MIKKFLQKKCNIYSGYIYKKNDGVLYISKNDLNEKAEIIEGPIFYKRGVMDLYVTEINSGKKIPTYPLKKLIKFPKQYFVAIDKRRKFKEPLITLSYKEIAEKYNLNIFTDVFEIIKKMINQKSDLVEAYNQEKPNNYKEVLNKKMNKNNLSSKISIVKEKIKQADFKSKIKNLKNKITKKEEIVTTNKPLNDLQEESLIDNKVYDEIDQEKINDEVVKSNKCENLVEESISKNIINDEFIDNVEGLKVKKYDLCKEAKYVYGFNLKIKPVINLSTNNKSFEQVIAEMVYLNNLDYNVYADVDGIKLSTRGLKTTEELIEYYNYKKNNIFPTTTNAKIMARANRKLEKQKIKNMI